MPTQGYEFYLSRLSKDSEAPVITAGASGYFSTPSPGLDPRLFIGTKMIDDVREWVLDTVYEFWGKMYSKPRTWSTVWAAGSGVSYQWDADRGNGDMDILIVVDFGKFFNANTQFAGIGEEDMATRFNQEFHDELWPITDRTHVRVNSNLWQENPSSTQSSSSQPSVTIWTEARPSVLWQSNTESATTPSLPTLSSTASRSQNAPAVLEQLSAQSALSDLSSSVVNVRNAKPYTSGSITSGTSTALTSKSTRDFWKNKTDDALSALSPQFSGQDPSTSIMTTQPERSEEYSAIPVTTHSESSEILSRVSNEQSTTSTGAQYDGIYSVTFYVNPGATDIRDINPYAAYNLTKNTWTVHPPRLPEDPKTLYPTAYFEAAERERQQAAGLVERYTTIKAQASAFNPGSPGWVNAMAAQRLVVQQAANLFDSIHLGRRNAFGPSGQGYGDFYNFRWQSHKANGVVDALRALKETGDQASELANKALYGEDIESVSNAITRASLWNAGALGG